MTLLNNVWIIQTKHMIYHASLKKHKVNGNVTRIMCTNRQAPSKGFEI